MKSLFNEGTLMPVSMVLLIIAAAAWMTKVEQNANATSLDLKEFKYDTKEHYEKFEAKLDKMNEKIDRLLENQKAR